MEPQELIDIFYSNYNAGIDYAALKDIYELVSNEYLKIAKIEICSLGDFKDVLDKILSGDTPICEYDGGGRKHIALKVAAGKYILDRFGQKCNYLLSND